MSDRVRTLRACLTPAVTMGISISVATGLYGISFGALGVASGLSVLQTQLLSMLMFTGGSQFAFIGALAGGGAQATIAASLLGIRNAIYGAGLNASLKPRGRIKPMMALLTIDESFATSTAQETYIEQKRGFWTAGVGVWLLWNLFTFVGASLGQMIADPGVWGLDGAAVAAFLGLLWPRLKDRESIGVAIVCAAATVIAIPYLPAGMPLLISAGVAVLSIVAMTTVTNRKAHR